MKNILVACEESQEVVCAFRNLGFNAFSCDLQLCSGEHPEWHINSDVLPLLNGYCSFFTQNGEFHYIGTKWDLIVAFPPCTYMTKASACRMYPRAGVIDTARYLKCLAAREFFYSILNSNCDFICIENPTPLKVAELPVPTQIIQPYYFGHPYSKRTCLWLKNLPPLKSTNVLSNYTPFVCSNTSLFSKGHKGSRGVASNSKTRSKTFSGVASAMAEQWGALL